jgi:hypothetical protein
MATKAKPKTASSRKMKDLPVKGKASNVKGGRLNRA